MNTSIKLSSDFPELLKLETSVISFLYVVLGFSVTAITGHNKLLIDLAQGGLPDKYVPYWPLFSHIVTFTIINMAWVSIGLFGAFYDRMPTAYRSKVAYLNGLAFVIALGYFAYIASKLVDMLKF